MTVEETIGERTIEEMTEATAGVVTTGEITTIETGNTKALQHPHVQSNAVHEQALMHTDIAYSSPVYVLSAN